MGEHHVPSSLGSLHMPATHLFIHFSVHPVSHWLSRARQVPQAPWATGREQNQARGWVSARPWRASIYSSMSRGAMRLGETPPLPAPLPGPYPASSLPGTGRPLLNPMLPPRQLSGKQISCVSHFPTAYPLQFPGSRLLWRSLAPSQCSSCAPGRPVSLCDTHALACSPIMCLSVSDFSPSPSTALAPWGREGLIFL